MNLTLDENKQISKDQLKTIDKNFKLIDNDRDGFLEQSEVRILHRAFGQNVTEEELDSLMKGMPNKWDMNTFLDFFKKNYRDPTSEATLVQAFQVFDVTDRGSISLSKFKEVIETLGEPLPEDDLTEILEDAKIEDGELDYVSFAKYLTRGPKGMRP